jgi:DeoR/GlpR family transcriptional regulator of sugar metabolism
MIRKGFCSSYGFFAETMLGNITVSKLFFSVDAIDPEMGLKSYTMDDLNIKKIGIANASERILLCDHSKFQSRAMFSIAGLDAIDTIIVGNELEESIAQKLSHMGKKLLLV